MDTVSKQVPQAGIWVPEIATYNTAEINAFATGMSRKNALVAVSTGLLERSGRDEAEAVLEHEISYTANGDLITLI